MIEIDGKSKKEVEKFLREAAELPRRRLSHAVKEGMKPALTEAKAILNSNSDDYKMHFKDGSTWEKNDVKKNLAIKLEKGKNKAKRVAQLGIKDDNVAYYSNFIEFGYKNPRTGQQHQALHFMRESLIKTKKQVEDTVIKDLSDSLDKLRGD